MDKIRQAGELEELDLSRVCFGVIDPNKHMRTLLKEVVRSLGGKVVCEAENVPDAVQSCYNNRPDIVLSELVMDGGGGFEFTRAIRSEPDLSKASMPIILVTAATEQRHILTARDVGVNEFVAKPVSIKQLYKCISHVITKPRPFVMSANFRGPCRRRHRVEGEEITLRRARDWHDACAAACEQSKAARDEVRELAGKLGGGKVEAQLQRANEAVKAASAAVDAAAPLYKVEEVMVQAEIAQAARDTAVQALETVRAAYEAVKKKSAPPPPKPEPTPEPAPDPGAMSQAQVASLLGAKA
ncbi:MAG: response regulator [Alphaproteobacteria bacterium]|nr:response regulator [Alphaproteobacteria bacterium]